MGAAKATTRWRRGFLGLATLLAIGGTAPSAHAYAEQVHAAMPRWIFPPAVRQQVMPAVAPGALTAMRRRFYHLASHLADAGLRRRFLARYPSEAAFDSAAFKTFLALNPQATVWGIDQAPEHPQRLGEVWSYAAAAPDHDWRNRDRLWRDARGRAIRLTDGSPVPVDPMILAIGRVTGVSSQAHAHYGLPPIPKSEDPAVLKAEPWRWAIPASIVTYADSNAQLWTDLAILAGVAGQPTLAAVHEGAWQHFAEDVANQVHTVQAGLYAFFVDAKIQSILDWCWSLGGLWRAPIPFRQIGITIVTNHHLLSELYFEKRMDDVVANAPRQSAKAAAVLTALAADDDALAEQLRATWSRPDWASAMIDVLSEVSSREGADLYRATRGFAQKRLSQAGVTFEGGHRDADAYVRPPTDSGVPEALDAYYRLYGNAFRRAGTMVRLWQERYRQALTEPHADEAAVARIVDRQLRYWEAAEARRRQWLADKTLLNPALANR